MYDPGINMCTVYCIYAFN